MDNLAFLRGLASERCDLIAIAPSFGGTLNQTRVELQEAVQLQLNEVERIADVRGHLADNEVAIQPPSSQTNPRRSPTEH